MIVKEVELKKGKSNQWYWRMISRNGRILDRSETYTTKRKALITAQKVADQLNVPLLLLNFVLILSLVNTPIIQI